MSSHHRNQIVARVVARVIPLAAATFLSSLSSIQNSHAQDPSTGKAIADRHCSRCHATGISGESPMLKAFPFRLLVKRYKPEQLEEALAEGIVVGHPLMPEFVFEPEEIGALVSYLETLTLRGQ